MPDDDRIGLRLSRRWWKVLRCLERRDSMERTEDVIVGAIASTVRNAGGAPELPDLAIKMQRAAIDGSPDELLRQSPSARVRNVPARLLEQAAAALAATMRTELALVSPEKAAVLLAKRFLQQYALYAGLERMVPVLVEDGTYRHAELKDVLSRVLDGEQFEKLAKSVTKHPNGKGLRAPNRRAPQPSHDELMDTDL